MRFVGVDITKVLGIIPTPISISIMLHHFSSSHRCVGTRQKLIIERQRKRRTASHRERREQCHLPNWKQQPMWNWTWMWLWVCLQQWLWMGLWMWMWMRMWMRWWWWWWCPVNFASLWLYANLGGEQEGAMLHIGCKLSASLVAQHFVHRERKVYKVVAIKKKENTEKYLKYI